MILGERIQNARKRVKMTQLQVANNLGASYASVCQWETNRRTPKSGAFLEMLKLFACPVSDFFPFANNKYMEVLQIEAHLSEIEEEIRDKPEDESEEVMYLKQQYDEIERHLYDYIKLGKKNMDVQNIKDAERAYYAEVQDIPTFAGRLGECMKKKEVSKEQLAKKSGNAQHTIESWLKGEKIPKMKEIEQIAFWLEIPVVELYDYTEEELKIAMTIEDIMNGDEKEKHPMFVGVETGRPVLYMKARVRNMYEEMRRKLIMEKKAYAQQSTKQNRGGLASTILAALRSSDTEADRLAVLADILQTVSEAARQSLENVRAKSVETNGDNAELLEAYMKLNAEGKEDALRYVKRLQYIPEYQMQQND